MGASLTDAQKVRPARPQASRNRRRALQGHVEDFDELRTMLADFFSIRLQRLFELIHHLADRIEPRLPKLFRRHIDADFGENGLRRL